MSPKRPTPTVEDYLGIIFTLQRDHEKIKGARLAELLNVSAPTVTVTLKRMQRDGWIETGPNREIKLTSMGKKAAESVMRRHMLTEWLLSKALHIPWANSHMEAHEIEHAISPVVEERLMEELEDKTICPHGNPLPGHENAVKDWLPINEFPEGSNIIIRRVHEFGEEQPELLRFLEEHGILPGAHATVHEILPFNQTMTLIVNNEIITLGNSTTQYLYAELDRDQTA